MEFCIYAWNLWCLWFCAGVYSLCDRPGISRGPYFAMATICSVLSLIFVSLKASYVFSSLNYNSGDAYGRAMEIALFLSSWILAIGHIVVAYRISCRERRKLLVYKIDIEAVSVFFLIFILFHDQLGRFEKYQWCNKLIIIKYITEFLLHEIIKWRGRTSLCLGVKFGNLS